MKITKQKLQKIIREELRAVLEEATVSNYFSDEKDFMNLVAPGQRQKYFDQLSREEFKKLYRAIAHKTHPDLGGGGSRIEQEIYNLMGALKTKRSGEDIIWRGTETLPGDPEFVSKFPGAKKASGEGSRTYRPRAEGPKRSHQDSALKTAGVKLGIYWRNGREGALNLSPEELEAVGQKVHAPGLTNKDLSPEGCDHQEFHYIRLAVSGGTPYRFKRKADAGVGDLKSKIRNYLDRKTDVMYLTDDEYNFLNGKINIKKFEGGYIITSFENNRTDSTADALRRIFKKHKII